ncbi:META domain-containing protein [Phormidesmis priestleyi ULC007]|uniref:META domain-containing protein n=2 Tax=Phormidesmis priestleyi TaxID=268141 RepID=A0A2T1DNG8_9CYAN|nr:META domain-containing protein [Phormidesmis priestleyi]PSB21995.1 META domain-containing protein [Phormidesmis priestleyi ULC007]PZO55037.1 MAG: META domain-containing protein [Phormidesmis priestleyi]
MNYKSSSQQLTGCIVTLTIGLVGVTAANSAIAYPVSGKPLLMAQSASSIAGSWRLVIMAEPTSPGVVPQATKLTADFSGNSSEPGKANHLTGSGGCNRFMGSYQIKGNHLSIGTLASTRKACEESILNQEFRYLKALEGAQRYEVDSQGQLTIFYQTGQESGVLRFTSQTVRELW